MYAKEELRLKRHMLIFSGGSRGRNPAMAPSSFVIDFGPVQLRN